MKCSETLPFLKKQQPNCCKKTDRVLPIDPSVGWSSVPSIFSKVVFPPPEGPKNQIYKGTIDMKNQKITYLLSYKIHLAV